MLKSDKTKADSMRLSLGVKCKDCIHFKRGPAYFEKKCSELGILPEAKACEAFTPDVNKLTKLGSDSVREIGLLTKELTGSQLRIMSAIFRNMALLLRHDLRFGQPVFINMSSPFLDYLDCYYKAYVLGASKSGDSIYLTSSLKRSKDNVYIAALSSSVLTFKSFLKKKKELTKTDRIKTPKDLRPAKLENKKAKLDVTTQADTVTIDQVPLDWFSPAVPRRDDGMWRVKPKKIRKGIIKGRVKTFSITEGETSKKKKKKKGKKHSK